MQRSPSRAYSNLACQPDCALNVRAMNRVPKP
jgi:hypothetical protein